MASNQLYKELEDIISCSVCLERSTDPRSLPCLHTYCLDCINKIISKAGNKQIITCPSCRLDVTVPPGGTNSFPVAFPWKSIGETLDKFKIVGLEEVATKCATCSKDTPASFFCMDCMISICDECQKQHVQFADNHNILDCSSIKPDDLKLLMRPTSKSNKCAKHTQEDIQLYCETCRDLVCVICAVVDHPAHCKQELGTVVTSHRRQLGTTKGKVTQTVKGCREVIQKINQVKKATDKEVLAKVQMVQDYGKKLISTVHAFISSMVCDIKDRAKNNDTTLISIKEKLEQELTESTNTLARIDKALLEGNHANVIKMSVLHTNNSLLKNKKQDTNLPEIPQISFDLQLVDVQKFDCEQLIGKVNSTTTVTKPQIVRATRPFAAPSPNSKPFIASSANSQASAAGSSETTLKPLLQQKPVMEVIVRKVDMIQIPFHADLVTCGPDGKISACKVGVMSNSLFEKNKTSMIAVYLMNGNRLPQLQIPHSIGAEITDLETVGHLLLAADSTSKSIHVFNINAGTYQRSIPLDFEGHYGISVFGDTLYIASSIKHKVYTLHWPTGKNKQIFVEWGSQIRLEAPWFVTATDKNVAVSCRNNKVFMLNKAGKCKYTYCGSRSPRGLKSSCGVVIEANGRLLVSDPQNSAIHIVSPEGQFLGQMEAMAGVRTMAINPKGHLVVSSSSTSVLNTYQYSFKQPPATSTDEAAASTRPTTAPPASAGETYYFGTLQGTRRTQRWDIDVDPNFFL